MTDRQINPQDIVEQFCVSDKRIKLLKQANKKQAAARNTGIKTATR